MWHWNSWWAPAPGDPPAVDDPKLWRNPWSFEQAIALQTRNWETFLEASHSWWAMAMTAWPLGLAALPKTGEAEAPVKSATVHSLPPPPRKRPAAKRSRSG